MNGGQAARGCDWFYKHTLAEWMELFDRLPRHLRDELNYDDPDGALCVHCVAKSVGVHPRRGSKKKRG